MIPKPQETRHSNNFKKHTASEKPSERNIMTTARVLGRETKALHSSCRAVADPSHSKVPAHGSKNVSGTGFVYIYIYTHF